ncbi:MAG TPA: SdpI family protein [Flavisolibacter sp.]|jgi:uncharacterized membrane protein|nr:SdpI family protein [Flavisolibacter sp.]
MKKHAAPNWIAIMIALVPAAYLALVWNDLPDVVPVHFGSDFKPDRYGKKEEMLVVTAITTLVAIGVYFLLNNLHRIDPKRKGTGTPSSFNKLAMGLVVFIAAMTVIIIASAKGSLNFQKLVFPVMGLFFAFIGNYMNNIKPNYFAGIRLPWTLSSDENWRRTHLLAGKLWFGGGIIIALLGVILPISALLPAFFTIMVIMVIIPVVFSYRLFKQQQ